MRTPERCDEGDRLDGLSESHLIRKDGMVLLPPFEEQPVEPLQLVVVQRAAAQKVRRGRVLALTLQHTSLKTCRKTPVQLCIWV